MSERNRKDRNRNEVFDAQTMMSDYRFGRGILSESVLLEELNIGFMRKIRAIVGGRIRVESFLAVITSHAAKRQITTQFRLSLRQRYIAFLLSVLIRSDSAPLDLAACISRE